MPGILECLKVGRMAIALCEPASYIIRVCRRLARYILSALLAVTAWPIALLAAGLAVVADRHNRFVDVSFCLAYLPFAWGEHVRYYFYRLTCEGIGENCVFKFGSICHYRKTKIGTNVLVGFHTVLGEITIGDNVLIGSHVLFFSGKRQHCFEDPTKSIYLQPCKRIRLTVGHDVWIGGGAKILANIGTRCVIGAGAVVVDDVKNGSVVGGNPARTLRRIEISVLRTNNRNSG